MEPSVISRHDGSMAQGADQDTIKPLVDAIKALSVKQQKLFVKELVEDMSPWQRLGVKQLLRLNGIVLAGMADVPPDIHYMIAKYLDLADVVHCAQVSKEWRAIWKFEAVSSAMCRRYFPGLLETTPLSESGSYAIFIDAARKYLARVHNKYQNRSVVRFQYPDQRGLTVDLDLHPGGILPIIHGIDSRQGGKVTEQRIRRVTYSNGKVFWHPVGRKIVIDDLHSKKRRVVSLPGTQLQCGGQADILAVGPNILVVAELEDDWNLVNLPSEVIRCDVSGDCVAFICASEIYLWTAEQRVKQLDTFPGFSADEHWNPKLAGMFSHPTDKTITFIAMIVGLPCRPEENHAHTGVRIMVHELKHCAHVKTVHLDFKLTDGNGAKQDRRLGDGILTTNMTCLPLNAWGSDISVGVAIVKTSRSATCECWKDERTRGKLAHIKFDVFSRTFSVVQYRVEQPGTSYRGRFAARQERYGWIPRPGSTSSIYGRVWGDQLLCTGPGGSSNLNLWPDDGQQANTRVRERVPAARLSPFVNLLAGHGLTYADEDFVLSVSCFGFTVWDCRLDSDRSLGSLHNEEPNGSLWIETRTVPDLIFPPQVLPIQAEEHDAAESWHQQAVVSWDTSVSFPLQLCTGKHEQQYALSPVGKTLNFY